MPIQSDLTLDVARFHPDNTPEDLRKLQAAFFEAVSAAPSPWEIGWVKFRKMQQAGTAGWPAPVHLPGCVDEEIPSREPGRSIPVRVCRPANGAMSKGIFLHLHGGGWCANTHRDYDDILKNYADNAHVTVISAGYRLAPEHTYPAGPDDCLDAAAYLTTPSGAAQFNLTPNQPFLIGGESAGAHLAALTAFRLIRRRSFQPSTVLPSALILAYGVYDLSSGRYVDAFLGPGMAKLEQRRSPDVSPLSENLISLAKGCEGGKLPPALVLCGGADMLLDESVRLAARWMASGSEAVLKVFPGAPHAFDVFGPGTAAAGEMRELEAQFVREIVGA